MTDFMHYEKGCSPSAIQRKYSLTYVQGYEIAERLKKTQELELEVRRENAQLKELLKECREVLNDAQRNYGYDDSIIDICYPVITKIDEVLK